MINQLLSHRNHLSAVERDAEVGHLVPELNGEGREFDEIPECRSFYV